MNNKWLKIVIAASLALNLAFAAPYLYNKFLRKSPTPEETKHTKPDLNLRQTQKEQLRAIFKEFRVHMMELKQDILAKRIDIIDELGDPEFDPQTITKLTGELNKLENQLNLLFVDSLIRTNALLDPDQRLRFLYHLSKDWFFLDKGRPFRKESRDDRDGGNDWKDGRKRR